MAIRKLSPSLFSANAGTSQREGLASYLHFISDVPNRSNRYALVCEAAPLLTATFSGLHGWPKRCPFCGQDDPIGNIETPTRGEMTNARQQG
jgi:hypothetical protein